MRQLHQDFEAFSLLVDAGADLSVRDDQGDTIMRHIAEFGDDRYVAVALRAGAELEPRGQYGWTTVHVAAIMLNPSVLRALIAAGAATDPLDDEGRTPRQLVESDNDLWPPEAVSEILTILDH